MSDETKELGEQPRSLDGLVRKVGFCKLCGAVVEGKRCRQTGRFQITASKKCGCEDARKEVSKKLGVPYVPPND